MDKPTAKQVKAFRLTHRLTQQQMADLLYISLTAYRYYEYGTRSMPVSSWELLQIKLTR